MKFSTTASSLLSAVSLATKVIPTRSNLVAYTGVHLEVAAGRLTVSGSDGETTVAATRKVSGTVAGSVLLPPRPVTRYLATLPADTAVTVESVADTEVSVTAADGSPYGFKTIATTFPTPPSLRRDKKETDLSGLAEAVAAVGVSAIALTSGKDKVVQLVSDDEGIKLHSTDRYRLTRAVLPKGASFGTFDGLMPLRVLELAASIEPTHVQVDGKGKAIVFCTADTTVTTRLISDPFPTVDSVLGSVPHYTVQLPREQVLAALRRLSAIAEPGIPLVATLAGDELTLTMRSNNLGSGVEVIALAEQVGAEVAFGANLEFLEDALGSHRTVEVTLGWSAPLLPLFVTSPSKVPVINVIMPVQFS